MRKPKIKIVPTGSTTPGRRWLFCVVWRGNHFKNSQWWTFDDALIAAKVKKA